MSNNLGQPPKSPGDIFAPKKKNNRRLSFLISAIALVLLFAGGIIALVFTLTGPATDAAEKFLNDISAGETSIAYEKDTSIGFKKVVSRAAFDTFLDTYPVLKNVESHFFSSRHVTGNSFAVIRGTITAEDGQVSPINIELVNENDEWKVLNLDLNPPPELADDDFDEEEYNAMEF